jgi:hypothetical protein
MYIKINETQFVDHFRYIGRENQFSYNAKLALFEYLESLEAETGDMKLDVIALCCEYSEFKNFEELKDLHPDIETMDQLIEKTTVIEFEGGFLINNF